MCNMCHLNLSAQFETISPVGQPTKSVSGTLFIAVLKIYPIPLFQAHLRKSISVIFVVLLRLLSHRQKDRYDSPN